MSQLATVNDYKKLPADLAKWLAEKTAAVRFTARRGAEETLRLGLLFAEVRAKIGRGMWASWLRNEFAYSKSHAARMMKVAEQFGGHMAKIGQFDASALYVLVNGATHEARVLALQYVDRGERITKDRAIEIVAACKPPAVTKADMDEVQETRKAISGLNDKVVPPPVQHTAFDALAAVVERCSSVEIARREDLDTQETTYSVTTHSRTGVQDAVGHTLSEALQQAAGVEPVKKCKRCLSDRPLYSGFSRNRSKADGRASACKQCEVKRAKRKKMRLAREKAAGCQRSLFGT